MKRLAAACLVSLAVALTARAPASEVLPSVTVVSVPHLRASDLDATQTPAIRDLTAVGAVGWMNIRAARIRGGDDTSLAACYLTLGSGSRATAAGPRQPSTEPVPSTLFTANAVLDHRVDTGALGDACRKAGLRIRVCGGRARGDAALLAMDSEGRIDEIIDASRSAPEAPFGMCTDSRLLKPVGQPGWLSVLCYDDLLAADLYAPLSTPTAARSQRLRALEALDTWVATAVLPEVRLGRGLVVLIAPTGRTPNAPKALLSPFGIWGAGYSSGLATSASTRRSGLVSAVDLLPTIGAYLQVPVPASATGRPIVATSDTSSSWRSLHGRWMAIARTQHRLGGMPTLRLVLVVLAATALLASRPRPAMRHLGVSAALLLLALPSVQMLVPIAQGLVGSPARALIIAAAVLSAIAAAYPGIGRRELALPGAFSGAVAADLLLGAPAQQVSWAGYSVLDGARYYGIGNEAAGAFLASMLLVAVPASGPRAKVVRALVLAAATLVLLHPRAGANLGCAAACAVAAVVVSPRPRSRRACVAASAVAALLVVAVLVIVAADRGQGASHLGMALTKLGDVPRVAWRKLALNAHLLASSAWTPTLVAATAMALLLQRRPGATRHQSDLLRMGVVATALLLANDSGVAAAGEFLCVAVPGVALFTPSEAQASQPKGVRDHTD